MERRRKRSGVDGLQKYTNLEIQMDMNVKWAENGKGISCDIRLNMTVYGIRNE